MRRLVKKFEDALKRLVDGKPKRVAPGYKINYDTVALEAGSKKGTIRKARYPILCQHIRAEANKAITPVSILEKTVKKRNGVIQKQEQKISNYHNREILLIDQLMELKYELSKLQGNENSADK